MPATYTLIASNTLGSDTASITFSSIPGTYTDLVLRFTARTNVGGNMERIELRLNGNSNTLYSYTQLEGNSSAGSSSNASDQTIVRTAVANGDNTTASTFASGEIYIPSYTASQNKPIGSFSVTENNATTANAAYINATSNLFRSTTAISSVALTGGNSGNFLSGSSFFLYGIKNS